MKARSKARKRALDVLYESALRSTDPMATLTGAIARADPPVAEYAVDLVEGVCSHLDRIDELIAGYAIGWTPERMPPVDRAILRLGIFELLWCDDVPDAVVIDEAVQLAKDLSTEDSPSYVNGLLGRILAHKPTLTG
ncbi:MAG TPA: transcription antitermination factor NusB [Mycobacteriales bacterium]|nr:transcription antitermination factor NusB [Mycobacteriales bacterium]